MSKVVEAAVAALDPKAKGFDGTAKFVIEGEGAVYIDAGGARAADDEAEVTLTASRETFEGTALGRREPHHGLHDRQAEGRRRDGHGNEAGSAAKLTP